ncbi:Uncharacterized conserved protein [Actinacidiphila yanglinensis]|uniref:Uncharacterized conserved protein n=1 Tax=Actinacidiphila yanglinensis TaxID=310779 RepID=A0A1H6DTF6_9ACTN|nr:hypothetical protein [Actinacidiphila yanglinensis]SEG88627.1 Uncharacterized conserved protein [Actinacidiphila yanglinensis]
MDEIWILGATGRSGRAIATRLALANVPLTLVGRDSAGLDELAGTLGGAPRTIVLDPAGAARARAGGAGGAGAARRAVAGFAARIAAERPAVVVNTIGPFTETAPVIARACPPGTHYVDLANELPAVTGLLGMHDEAVADGRCLVTGAGFGVLATESVVLALCAGRPAPARVRVDALAAVANKPGRLGTALAASIVDAVAVGGRRYERGRLVRARLAGDFERFALPDDSTAHSASGPSGELEAAHRASGAPWVVAASGAMPAGRAVRAVLPATAVLLAWRPFGNAVKRRLARVRVTAGERSREFSWARARVEDADGGVREGWLRAGEALDFTASAAAEVAARLARSEGRPGAYTPGALFGPDLAVAAGGTLLVDGAAAGTS